MVLTIGKYLGIPKKNQKLFYERKMGRQSKDWKIWKNLSENLVWKQTPDICDAQQKERKGWAAALMPD